MAKLFTPRNLFIASGVGAAFYLFPRSIAKVNPIQDGIKTPASQSIADRFSAGGGSSTHLPGAGSKRGTTEEIFNQANPSGVKSEQFQKEIADQKIDDYGAAGRTWNKSHYGTDKGK